MLNSATIKSIQDIMRKDAGVDGDAQRLGQLTWLFFLKIFDDREQEWEITVKKYRSPVPEELRWRNWAADTEGLTGDGLLEFINNKLFPSLKGLSPEASPRHRVIHDVFEDAYQYMKNGTLLRQVINKITESLDFNRMEEPSFANRVETPQAWKVPVEQIIAAGYNLDIKNPHDAGEGNADPDELLIDYQRSEEHTSELQSPC